MDEEEKTLNEELDESPEDEEAPDVGETKEEEENILG